jgi:hypothetical protein
LNGVGAEKLSIESIVVTNGSHHILCIVFHAQSINVYPDGIEVVVEVVLLLVVEEDDVVVVVEPAVVVVVVVLVVDVVELTADEQ